MLQCLLLVLLQCFLQCLLVVLLQCLLLAGSGGRAGRPGSGCAVSLGHARPFSACLSTLPARCASPLTAHHMCHVRPAEGHEVLTGNHRLCLPKPYHKTEPSGGWTHMSIGSGSSTAPVPAYSRRHTHRPPPP